MKRPAASIVAGLLAAALSTGACGGEDGPEITVGTVGRADVTEVVNAPGSVVARAEALLTAAANGEVAEVFVGDGAKVARGVAILRIASPSAVQQLHAARDADARATITPPSPVSLAALRAMQAQTDAAAQAAFAAARAAANSNPDPRQRRRANDEIDAAERRYAAARAEALRGIRDAERGLASASATLGSVASAQRVQTRAAVTLAERTVAALVVRSPISGTVQLGGATPTGGSGTADDLIGSLPPQLQGQAAAAFGGQSGGGTTTTSVIAPGVPVDAGAVVATVFDTGALALRAEVDETDITLVRPGTPALAELDAFPGARFIARVSAVDLAPTTSSRGGVSYGVRLSLGAGRMPDGDVAPRPRPGMSAVVDLTVRAARAVIAVPAAAVIRDGAVDAVWLLADGRARRQVVSVGAQGESLVEIRSGLEVGQRIVVRGADAVTAGQRVS